MTKRSDVGEWQVVTRHHLRPVVDFRERLLRHQEDEVGHGAQRPNICTRAEQRLWWVAAWRARRIGFDFCFRLEL